MEIFPKLTDPIGWRQSWGGARGGTTHANRERSSEVRRAGAQRRVCINICAYVNALRGELTFRHASFTLERHLSGPSNYFLIILDAQETQLSAAESEKRCTSSEGKHGAAIWKRVPIHPNVDDADFLKTVLLTHVTILFSCCSYFIVKHKHQENRSWSFLLSSIVDVSGENAYISNDKSLFIRLSQGKRVQPGSPPNDPKLTNQPVL